MSLIIDHPKQVPFPRRLGWGCVTVVFWMLWVYLWLPLLTLVAWSFGVYQGYDHFRWQEDALELKRLVGLYSVIIAALGGALLLWALSEYMRFRHKHRRAGTEPVTPAELGAAAGIDAHLLAHAQQQRCLLAFHDAQGSLLGVEEFKEFN